MITGVKKEFLVSVELLNYINMYFRLKETKNMYVFYYD